MKNIINIHLAKDTPTETIKELSAILKLQNEKPSNRKQSDLYASNEDIEKLHERYEQLFKKVKNSPDLSEKQIEKECDTLSRKYDFELEELSKRRKVDYDKEQAEIKARAKEETPWRRGWWWRLIFQPLTNRAQDIIEKRAELDADRVHSDAEKAIEDDQKKLPTNSNKKLSLRKRKRAQNELKKIIEAADDANGSEMFVEPLAPQDEPKQNTETPKRTIDTKTDPREADTAIEPQKREKPDNAEPAPAELKTTTNAGQLPGQLTLDDVQQMPTQSTRRPRPPRSCRKPS